MSFILCAPACRCGLGTRLWTHYEKLRGTLDTEAAAMAGRHTPQPGQAVPEFLCRSGAGEKTVLECDHVSKRFGEFAAVDRAEQRLADRCLHALIRPYGAATTTQFNLHSGT